MPHMSHNGAVCVCVCLQGILYDSSVLMLNALRCVFAGMGTQWAGMGRSLMQLQEFRESILRSDTALRDTGLCVSSLLMEADETTFEDTVHAFVGLAAIQVRRRRIISQ